MARIRSIKPEFWVDEKVVELSFPARLLFIGLWNFADDDGRMAYSPKKIKMQIFPADNVDTSELFGELRRNSLIDIYTVDNTEYLQIKNFAKHQKVDKRTPSKLPSPPNSPESPGTVPTEGKGRDQGMEGKGGEEEEAGKPATPGCPHQEIIALYHELLPLCPRVKVWNETRQGYLRARWRERDKNQSLDFWRDYFTHVSKSKFLTGQANGRPGMPPFVADLEWLIKPENFAKVLEGKYDREAA